MFYHHLDLQSSSTQKYFAAQISALREGTVSEPHGVQESPIDSLSKEEKLVHYKQQANIPWSSSTQCSNALNSNQQAVAEYIILKVGQDCFQFGRCAVKAIFAEDWYGCFRVTEKGVNTWKLENLIVYKLGRPTFKLPPLFMTLMDNLITGHYGELTGYLNPPRAEKGALKMKKTLATHSVEEVKEEWTELQVQRLKGWFKDRANALRKKTYVSTMANIYIKT